MIQNVVNGFIKGIMKKLGYSIVRYTPKGYEAVSIAARNGARGNVLLSYIIEPFLLKPDEPISNAHTHDWESFQIAQTFLDLGYSVDVIDYRNESFVPRKEYAFFVGARTNFERIAHLLNKGCVKIAHMDTAHWIFNNHASLKRLLDLQSRRGVTIPLTSVRQVSSNLAIEHADYVTFLGNQFTMSTYKYAQKSLFPIPISTCAIYPSPEAKDFESCRKSFLWFGSSGMVHKGLDLVLDVFSEMPDYHLYICGPVQQEKDFVRAYYRELYQIPNIHTIGWVDVNSAEFIEIINKCVGLIYPSSSEGQCGSVVNCLHAGLIPIISYQSGLDVNGFGMILKDCSIDVIKDAVHNISNLPSEELWRMALKTWEFARANHTRKRFAEEYRKVIEHIIIAQKRLK